MITVPLTQSPAAPLPSTGVLRDIFMTRLSRYAQTGDEQAFQDAQWANRLLTQIHQERRERAEKGQGK